MQISEKLQEYLINSLMRDKENSEREILLKEDVIAKLGIENGKEKTNTEDWKYKYFRLEDENCELKKKVKRLENDKTFHINELQKNNNAIKEVEELKKEIESYKRDYEGMSKNAERDLKKNQELSNRIKELEETVKSQESEILKITMNNIGKEVKRGRPAKKD